MKKGTRTEDDHLLRVLRYVERNPLRAGLVRRAESWRWSSLGRRQAPEDQGLPLLHAWPVARPANWVARVHRPQSEAELTALRQSVVRSQPYGSPTWQQRIAKRLGLGYTLRSRGRPRKARRRNGPRPL